MSMTPSSLADDTTPASSPSSREQVHLGNRIVELAPEDAATVRQAFLDLGNTYGAALDQTRRELLSTMGTPQWQAPPPAPPDAALDVPDPDLLFSNKDAWAASFANTIEGRIRRAQAEQVGLVQGAVAAVDQELKRRDMQQQAQTIHDSAMEEMLERRGLSDHRRIVQTIYNEQYPALSNLPLGVALDQLGALAEQEIAHIRGGQPAAAQQQTAPPAMIRSGRRASAPAPEPAPHGKTLTDLIRAHHQQFLEGKHAA
jgi:hypothetical protein